YAATAATPPPADTRSRISGLPTSPDVALLERTWREAQLRLGEKGRVRPGPCHPCGAPSCDKGPLRWRRPRADTGSGRLCCVRSASRHVRSLLCGLLARRDEGGPADLAGRLPGEPADKLV